MTIYVVESEIYYDGTPEVNIEQVFAARKDAEVFVAKANAFNAVLSNKPCLHIIEHEVAESENFQPQNICVSIWEAEDGSLSRPYVFATAEDVHPMEREEEPNCINYAASWRGVFPYQEGVTKEELVKKALGQCKKIKEHKQ